MDDLHHSVRSGFERSDQDIRDLRAEIRSESAALREEMRDGFAEMRGEMAAMRLVFLRLGGGLMVGLAGIIITLLVQGPA